MSNTRIIEIPATMQTGKGKNHAIRKLRVAAYCRVSTEEEEQQSSFETQKLYYTEKITSTPEWEIAGIYADDGISGVHTKKRDGFNQMMPKLPPIFSRPVITLSVSVSAAPKPSPPPSCIWARPSRPCRQKMCWAARISPTLPPPPPRWSARRVCRSSKSTRPRSSVKR